MKQERTVRHDRPVKMVLASQDYERTELPAEIDAEYVSEPHRDSTSSAGRYR